MTARGRPRWTRPGTTRRRTLRAAPAGRRAASTAAPSRSTDDERGRPAGARDLLQDGLHARGMGAQAVDEARRRRGRLLGRQPGRRRDDLGRPRVGPVPARARHQLRQLLDSGRTPTVGQWQHVAATYDGTTARFYVDGVETASAPYAGNVGDGNSWRIGAYGAPATGFFDGSVDNVRIYDRALSAGEIETDAASRIQPDSTAPSVTQLSPAPGATGVDHRQLRDGNVRRADEGVDDHDRHRQAHRHDDQRERRGNGHVQPATRTARLTPQAALQFGRATSSP